MFLKPRVFLFKKTSILFESKNLLFSSFQSREPLYLAELKELKTLNFKKMDWKSGRTYLILNPRMPLREISWIKRASFPYLKGHIWLKSSGTSSFFPLRKKIFFKPFLKYVALSKSAFLSSAQSVNQHIKSKKSDIWLKALPSFHVGGLSIFARAYLSGAQVVSFDLEHWDAKHFLERLYKKKVSLTSLVPTQLWDLVRLHLKPPKSLRVLFVGGDGMSPYLYSLAIKKGWKVLPTYGLTECASQVATADLSSLKSFKKVDFESKRRPIKKIENIKKGVQALNLFKDLGSVKDKERLKMPFLKILNSVRVRIQKGQIQIQSPSLFTGVHFLLEEENYFYFRNKEDWFKTGDLGKFLCYRDLEDPFHKEGVHKIKSRIHGNKIKNKDVQKIQKEPSSKRGYLLIQGRKKDEIKVGGEKVFLKNLFFILDQLRMQYSFSGVLKLIGTPSLRLGQQVDLVVERKSWQKSLILVEAYQKKVMPFERIQNIYIVEEIKKTALFKEKTDDLWIHLGFSFSSIEGDR